MTVLYFFIAGLCEFLFSFDASVGFVFIFGGGLAG